MIGVSIANSLGFTGASVLPDASAQAYFAATGITNVTQQQAIDTLIKGLKSDGIWSKMKAIYPFATDNRNLLGYTEDFDNSTGWGVASITRSGNTIAAPNGTLTADTITTSANTNNVIYSQNAYASSGQTFTHSIYVKYNNAQWLTVEIWNGGAQTGIRLWVDVQNGVLGTADATLGTYLSKSISNAGNGWYRVSVTGIMPSGQNVYLGCRHVDGNGAYNFTAVSGKSTYIWGAQGEIGTLSDYQPIATTQQAFIANQFKYNLKDPRDLDAAYRLVFNGGWTHSTLGATPNGTNGFADTKLNQTVAGMFGNSHLSYYSRTNNTTATQQIEMGAGANVLGTFSNLLLRLDTTTNYIGGSVGSRSPVSTSADSLGHVIVNALSASAKSFKNGSLIATDTSTQTGVLNTFPIYLGCQNNNGTASQYSTRQTAFASIGDGLTDTEAANLYTRVQAFQTALNRQV
jgi:hypothetical protein